MQLINLSGSFEFKLFSTIDLIFLNKVSIPKSKSNPGVSYTLKKGTFSDV